MLNGFKSQFFSGLNLFFSESTNGLFFPLCPRSSRLKSKSFIFFSSIVSRFGSLSLELLVQAAGKTDLNCSFNAIHCSCNMITCFSHTSHIRAMADLLSFQVLSKCLEKNLCWLGFSNFSSGDTIFTSWKITILQSLKPFWFIIAICFTILIVT